MKRDSPNLAFAYEVLQLESRYFGIEITDTIETISSIFAMVQPQLARRHLASQQVDLLSSLLFGKLGFRYCEGESAFLLSSTMVNRKGNCVGLTSLWTCICRALNIPIVPLLYEGHVCVALTPPNGKFEPIELSRGGIRVSKSMHRMMMSGKGNPQLLTDPYLLLVLESNIVTSGQLEMITPHQIADVLTYIVREFPSYLFGWINLAECCLQRNEFKKALSIFKHRALPIARGNSADRIRHKIDEIQEKFLIRERKCKIIPTNVDR